MKNSLRTACWPATTLTWDLQTDTIGGTRRVRKVKIAYGSAELWQSEVHTFLQTCHYINAPFWNFKHPPPTLLLTALDSDVKSNTSLHRSSPSSMHVYTILRQTYTTPRHYQYQTPESQVGKRVNSS